MNVATVAPFLAAALMRADAMRVLVLLRPTMARFAPSAASASAAAKPMPLVAPVIRICLSFTAQQSKTLATRETLAATRALVSSDISSRRRHDRAPMWQRGLHQFVPTQQVRRGCQGAIVATMDWLYPLSGFVVGAIVGLTGMGGGSLMTPLLILLFGVHPLTAVGTDLLYAAVTKTAGTAIHSKKGNVDWRVAGLLAAGSVPATVLTIWVLSRGAEAETDHSDYHIHVDGGGTDHRGRSDLLS